MATTNGAGDIELVLASNVTSTRLEGYPSFVQFIASDVDAAIYRRFGLLNARNLLYFQSELHELEEKLQYLDREDTKDLDDENAQKVAREWDYLNDPKNERAQKHMELQQKIRVTIKQYRSYRSML